MNYLVPPRLHSGDTVGVFYPAGPVQDQEALERGLAILKNFGLKVSHNHPDGSGPDFLAADDTTRVRELHRLLADDNIQCLMAARGGYGCLRLISQLDFDLIRSHPKWLIGFSDLSVLLNGIFTHTGMVTLHGPVVTSLPQLETASVDHFKKMLSNDFSACSHFNAIEVLRKGTGTGRIIGGNLTTISHLIGSPWQPIFTNSILLLEDTAEPPYKLDRMVTHLASCGVFDQLSGLILGGFDSGHDDPLATIRLNEQVWNRVLELSSKSAYPIWGNFPAGHQNKNFAVPIGMSATMDSSMASLQLQPDISGQ